MTDAAASPLPLTAADLARVQRRTSGCSRSGRCSGGIAFGATLSLGAVLAADISGDETFSGLAAAASRSAPRSSPFPLAATRGPTRASALPRDRHAARAGGRRRRRARRGGRLLPAAARRLPAHRRGAGRQPADALRRGRPRHRCLARPRPVDRRVGDDDRRRPRPEPRRPGRGPRRRRSGCRRSPDPYVFTVVAQVAGHRRSTSSALRPDPLLLAQRVVAEEQHRARTRPIAQAPTSRASRATRSSRSPPPTG